MNLQKKAGTKASEMMIIYLEICDDNIDVNILMNNKKERQK